MSLVIRTLSTRCSAPRPLASALQWIDGAARAELAPELGVRLGPSLDRDPGVVRIRTLPLRVALPAAELTPARLREAWASALIRELFRTLAYPPGEGPHEAVRYETRAKQLAAFVRAVFDGTADRWEFDELNRAGLAAAPAKIVSLFATRDEVRDFLAALEDQRSLEPFLLRLDDLALEQLLLRFAAESERNALRVDDVIAVAAMLHRRGQTLRAALREFTRAGDSMSTAARRIAIRLCASEDSAAPRTLFHAALALAAIVEAGTFAGAAEMLAQRPAPIEVRTFLDALRGQASPQDIESIARATADAGSTSTPEQLVRAPIDERWIESAVASIFLLAPIVQRLGWPEQQRDPAIGPRGFTYLLAGAAEKALSTSAEPPAAVDPAVALFAGCFGDLDVAGMRAFLAERDRDVARMAETLVAELRLRVRGFHDVPLPAIVRQFLRNRGRIRVTKETVTVVLDASPYHVALHLSGADDPIEHASWLERSVEFILKGI